MNRQEWSRLGVRFEDRICDITATDRSHVIRGLVGVAQSALNGEVLVDLGCGIGTFIRQFGRGFKKVIGVDYALPMISRARQRCAHVPGVTWMSLDIPRAADEIGPVADLTACLNVITSPSVMHRSSQWRAVASITRPGGFALVVVPAIESARLMARISDWTGRLSTNWLSSGFVRKGKTIQKYYAERELTSTLEANGLTVQRLRRAYYPWSDEGLPNALSRHNGEPWDWICLARRSEAGV